MGADASVGQLHQYLVVVVNGKVRPPMVAVPVTVTEPWAGMANEHFVGPGDLVFPFTTGGHRRGGEIRDMFYAALDDAGLVRLSERSPPIRFHDLRHTFGTIAVRVFDIVDVQAFMGHQDIQTTMRYVHHQPRHGVAQLFTEAVRHMAETDQESVRKRVPNRVPKPAIPTEPVGTSEAVPGEPQRIN